MRRRTYLAATAATLSLGGCAGVESPSNDTALPSDTTSAARTTDPSTSERLPTESEPTPTDTPHEVTPHGTPSEVPLKINYDVAEVKQNAKVVPYDTLAQNIDKYLEEPIYYEYAKVYRVVPSGAHTQIQMTVSTTSRDWQGVIGVDWASDEELIEGDVIQMWGFVRGLYEYETIQGDTRLAPSVQMVDYKPYESG